MKKICYTFLLLFVACSTANIHNTSSDNQLRKNDLINFFSTKKITHILINPDPNEIRSLIVNTLDCSKNDTIIFYENMFQDVQGSYESIVFESGKNTISEYSYDSLRYKFDGKQFNLVKSISMDPTYRCFIDSIKKNLNDLNRFVSRREMTKYCILTVAIPNQKNGYSISYYDDVKIPNSCFKLKR